MLDKILKLLGLKSEEGTDEEASVTTEEVTSESANEAPDLTQPEATSTDNAPQAPGPCANCGDANCPGC